MGVDAAAHVGALDWGGRTIAVLPGGLDRPSPARHGPLYETIAGSGGLLLSRFSDDAQASRASFHQRNQVIASLVDALITVCADTRSGSLHCSRRAWQAGVPIFAVPWSAGTANSEGSNGMLAGPCRAIWHRAGAHDLVAGLIVGHLTPALDSTQLPHLAWPGRRARSPAKGRAETATIDAERLGRQTCAPLDPPRWRAFEPPQGSDRGLVMALDAALSANEAVGITLEEAARLSGRPRGNVAAALLALGMSGQVRRGIGGRYRRCS
jgi:predicted Rossmann fold nucleotide-binding protein DprA/Smf involved in DNA uptake